MGKSDTNNVEDGATHDEQGKTTEQRAIVMEYSSAASPRWLSFAENRDIALEDDSVISFYTNTSLASLASSSVPDNVHDNDKRNDTRNRKGNAKTQNNQFYKVGIVRDGRVDVSTATDSPATSTGVPEASSQNIPWNEILGGLYTDLVMNCDEHLNKVSFGTSNSLFRSGYNIAIEGNNSNIINNSNSNQKKKHRRCILSRQTSAMDTNRQQHSLDDSNGQRLARSASAPVAAASSAAVSLSVSANEDEILRDLEQLEQQVNHQHQTTQASEDDGGGTNSNQSGKRTRALQELDIKANPNGAEVSESSMISSLLTKAMQRKNQEGLLCEEGVEIWYDAETQTFFRNTDSKSNIIHNSSINSSGPDTNKNDTTSPSRSGWQRNLCGGAFLNYCSTAADHRKHHFWHRFGRVAFFAAGVAIVVSSFSMALFGANILYEASAKASAVLGDTQNMTLEGSGIFDALLASSNSTSTSISSSILAGRSDVAPFSSSNNSTPAITNGNHGVLRGVFEDLTKRVFQSTNAGCDFDNEFIKDSNRKDNDLLLQEALENIVGLWNEHYLVEVDGVGSSEGMGLHKLEDIQNDLSRVSDDVASFEENWIGPYDSTVLVLRVINAMLGTACLLLLMGVATHRIENRMYRRILLPLFVTLVVLSLAASLFFMMGSTALEDFCGEEGPDEQVLEFLSAAKQREQSLHNSLDLEETADHNSVVVWSDLSYIMAEEYIQQCPSSGTEGIPKEAATLMEMGWEFARAFWEVSKLLMDTDTCASFVGGDNETPVIDGSSNSNGSVSELGEMVMRTACDFSVVLNDFVDILRCDNWCVRIHERFRNRSRLVFFLLKPARENESSSCNSNK
jgi:hypothetical protein